MDVSDRISVDFLVVGAGIFGVYAALLLHSRGWKVLLIEREQRPWQKASAVNQARIHFGYHYPRSISTALLANDYRTRFLEEHRAFVNYSFKQYYAVERFNSLTDASQFVRFCKYINIPVNRAVRDDLFVSERLEATFETVEHSFDPYLLRRHYERRLKEENVPCRLGETLFEAHDDRGHWRITSRSSDGTLRHIDAAGVINATYANLNTINRIFGVPELDVVHEISEIVLFKSSALAGVGLTVMDGPFISLMPFGKTGLHSLSSVLYTHHSVSTTNNPRFDCQNHRADCTPDAVRVCTECPVRPRSNARKMRSQMNLYVRPELDVFEYGSLFTVKTKLKSSFIDDSRPTNISLLRENPLFFSIFSGKVNSIYEVESVLGYV